MQLLFSILIYFSLYIILAISFKYLYATIRFIALSQAIIITFSAYLVFFFFIYVGFNLIISIILSLLISVIISVSTYLFIFKPFQKKQIPSWQMLIASLGVYIILVNIISMFFGDDTKNFRTWQVKEGHQLLGAYITDIQAYIIFTGVIIFILNWMLNEKINVGKQIKAVSSNPEMSKILGINKEKVILWSFVLSSLLASIAGILIASNTYVSPTMGFNWFLYAIIAMIIGGMGKMRYLLMGALLLATAQHLSAYYLDSKWMNATAFIILIIFLYFKPYGFSGKKLKKAEI